MVCYSIVLYAVVSGHNLLSAQTLYLLDPWWNSAVEEQVLLLHIVIDG